MYNSGFRGKTRTPDGMGTVPAQLSFVQRSDPQPAIFSWSIQGLDDRALNPAGGQTVVVNGAGFTTGMTVTVGTTAIGSVTIINSGQATFTSPAKSAGNYTLTIANSNGQAAILVPGLAYSTPVTWSTSAGNIGTTIETTAFTESVTATSDSAITYTLASGNLPTGATLNANGTITGTAASTASPTTYSFSITATDAELQDSTQSFTITVNPDTVTWSSPANGASYSVFANTPISNVTLSATSAAGSGITYTANTLPTGVSLTGNVISGTPTTAQSVSTLLTATANTTTRSATEVISWTVTLGDVYWPYVTLLLSGDTGTNVVNGAQNNTFLDSSTNNFTFTRNGNSTQGTFTPFSQNGWSNFFNGTSDYLTWVPTTSGQFGTGDFTVECWIYPTSAPTTQYLVDMRASAATTGWFFAFGAVSSGKLSWSYSAFSVTEATASVVANNWNHVAYSRSSGTGRLFVNGVLANSAADSNNYANNNGTAYIASRYDVNATVNPSTFPGYISNLRMVKGNGLYTANFTPPTSALTAISGTSLLTCQSNRFVDNSTNNYAITLVSTAKVLAYSPFSSGTAYSTSVVGGSGYFDGTGDNITTADNAAFNLSSGSWTIEGWCYLTGGSGYRTFITKRSSTNAQYEVGVNPSGYLYFYTSTVYASATLVVNNAWQHWAATYDGTNLRLFLNGVVVLTQASVTAASGTDPIYVGSTYTAGSQFITGYLSSVRILKGTALYTANFTPPTAPLTAIANTSLLLNFTNGGIVDAHSTNDMETVGNAQLNTTTTKYGTASIAFDGTGDYLAFQSGPNPNFAMGTGDWTIEMWMYPTSSAATQLFFDVYDGNSAGRLTLQLNTARTIGLYGASGAARTVTTGTVTLNTWQHIAFCKASGSTRIFINGVQSNTTYADSVNYTCTTGVIYLGANGTNGGNAFFGYIDDFRITKGIARYTSNFTPSSTAFPTQ